MCFPKSEYMILARCSCRRNWWYSVFYERAIQALEAYNLIIDAIDGGGGMFSLDNGTGKRFLTRSEICQVP